MLTENLFECKGKFSTVADLQFMTGHLVMHIFLQACKLQMTLCTPVCIFLLRFINFIALHFNIMHFGLFVILI